MVKTIINRPPVITIFMGGIYGIDHEKWAGLLVFSPHYLVRSFLIYRSPEPLPGFQWSIFNPKQRKNWFFMGVRSENEREKKHKTQDVWRTMNAKLCLDFL